MNKGQEPELKGGGFCVFGVIIILIGIILFVSYRELIFIIVAIIGAIIVICGYPIAEDSFRVREKWRREHNR